MSQQEETVYFEGKLRIRVDEEEDEGGPFRTKDIREIEKYLKETLENALEDMGVVIYHKERGETVEYNYPAQAEGVEIEYLGPCR